MSKNNFQLVDYSSFSVFYVVTFVKYLSIVFPAYLCLTTSKVMVIVWRLRGNIIRTVLYIAN